MALWYDPDKQRISSSDSRNNLHHFSPWAQNHLTKLYLTLCCTLLAAALGAYFHMLWNIGGIFTDLGFAGSMFRLCYTCPSQNSKRLSLLLLAALLKGASDGPLIGIDSSFVITAYVGTAVAFLCFYAAAMLAKCRKYLYLGGLISSAVFISVWLEFALFIFRGSVSVNEFEKLYALLLIFVGYIVINTQEITEQANLGDLDYVRHSFTFFTAVLARILDIMMKKLSKKNND